MIRTGRESHRKKDPFFLTFEIFYQNFFTLKEFPFSYRTIGVKKTRKSAVF